MRLWLSLLFLMVGPVLAAPPAKPPPPTSTMPSRRPPDPEIGETLWKRSCLSCHGELGKGDGPAAASVIGGVPSLEGKVTDANLEAMIDSVQQGKGKMPGFSTTIERPDTRRVLNYLQGRQSGKPAPSDAPPPLPEDKEKAEGAEGPDER